MSATDGAGITGPGSSLVSGGAGMAEREVGAPRAGRRLGAGVLLLALGSGAVDAFSFAGLGAVFASVMTGNLVLLGIAVVHAHADAALAAASAVAAYVAGVYGAAAWFRHGAHPAGTRRLPPRPRAARQGRHDGGTAAGARSTAPPAEPRPSPDEAGPGRARWGADGAAVPVRAAGPERLPQALLAVAAAQAGVLGLWAAAGGHPGRAAQLALLALSALGMGVQSAGVNTLRLTGAATTYLTGTLTTLTTELATSGVPSIMRRRFGVLAAALAGAGLDAVLLAWARPVAPALPLAATLAVLLLAPR